MAAEPLTRAAGRSWLANKLKRFASEHWLCKEPVGCHLYRLPLLWIAIALIVGVQLQRTSQLAVAFDGTYWLLGMLAGLFAAYACHRRGRPRWAGALSLLAAVCFGGCYALLSQPPSSDSLSPAASRKSEPIAIRGVIRSGAIWKPNPHYRPTVPGSQPWKTQWDIYCQSVRDGLAWQPIAADATLVVDGRIDDLLPGDAVEVLGSYRAIAAPANPGAFNFAEHFRQRGKFVSLFAGSRTHVRQLEVTDAHPLRRLRARLVRYVDHALHRWVVFEQAPLASALVFGQREQVDWENQQELMATGTLHLLAISGMHVEIVAGFILLAAAPFSLRLRTLLIAIVLVCGFYAALAGGKPPVLRAVLVVTAFTLARTLGRQARLFNILSLAAIVLLLIRVANIDNVGVHLSFLAVGTIGIFVIDADRSALRRSGLQSVIEESLNGWSHWMLVGLRSVQKMWMLSLWVWLLTAPLVWLNFHVVAPIAIPLNVLIAFPLMISLVAGLLTGVCGWLPPLAWLSGMVCGSGLSLISGLVRVGSQFPGGHLWLPAPAGWWVASFYTTIALWLLVCGRTRNRQLLVVLTIWMAVGLAPTAFGPRGLWWPGKAASTANNRTSSATPGLRCTFLDVGHGTSVILEMPDGTVWLYDAGHLGDAARSHQDIAAALWELPTARIDRLIISHADADHYNATQALCERFRIGQLASTQHFWQSHDRDVIALLDVLEQRGIRRATLQAGDVGRVGGDLGVRWRILHPPRDWPAESDNAASLCLLLEYAGRRILLPGDLEGSGLLDLVDLPPRPCHVLMAPHHGSVTLDPTQLLQWSQPEVVVISGNHRATRDDVIAKYRLVDSQLGITFRDGAIQIRIAASGELTAWEWHVDQWRPLP